MRTSVLLAVLLTASVAVANDDDRAAERPRGDLSPDEVRARVKTFDPDIARCYRDAARERAGDGRLAITLDIHRKGVVDRIDVDTPGLPAKLARRVDACVRETLDGLTFPERRVGTTATVPYLFQRTAAPGAGPVQSCWNRKGCAD